MSILTALSVIFLVAAAAVVADVASKEEGRRPNGIGTKGYIVYIVGGIILAFLMSHSKIIAVIAALAFGALALLNREGKKRASSWNLFLALNAVCMIYAIARGWDKMGMPKFRQLYLLLIPVVLIIASTINGKRVEGLTYNRKVMAEARAKVEKENQPSAEAEEKIAS